MQHSKLVQLLRTFDKKAQRRFDDYLRSPYFGDSEEAISLWEGLRSLLHGEHEDDLERLKVFERIYGLRGLPTEAEMARIMNILLSKAEHFTAMEALLAIPGEIELQSLTQMISRKLDKHVTSNLRKAHRVMDEMPLRDERWHYLRFQMNAQELAHLRRNQAAGADMLMENMAMELDAFYLSARLRIARERINRKNILATGQESNSLEPLWNLLESSPAQKAESVKVHAKVLKMLEESQDPSHFHDLRRLMRKEGRLLTLQERQEILTIEQNYCIRRVRKGDAQYLRELFDLYQEALVDGSLLDDELLSPWKYKNIASVGLQLGEFPWVETFIEQFKPRLPLEYRETAYAYNLADLRYHRKDYSGSLKTLMQVEFNDLVYALDTRKLQLKVYFEQGAMEPMLSLMQSFRKWLVRHKLLAEENRKAYLNFISLLHLIWKHEQDGKPITSAEREIKETFPLVDGPWLLRMANRL